jgi:hypothetical protein
MGVLELLGRLGEWLVPDDDLDVPPVDGDFLRSDAVQYHYVTVDPATAAEIMGETSVVRCDLCGALRPIDEAPELLAHVGEHDTHGAAEIDPFETDHTADPGDVAISGSTGPATI